MVDKVTVETTGDFILQDPSTLEVVEAFGSTEVSRTIFIDQAIESGRLKEAGKEAAEKPEDAPVDAPTHEPQVAQVEEEPRRQESQVPSDVNKRRGNNR